MTIDFTLDPARRALQLDARRAASEVLSQVRAATHALHTPGERFRATRPMYEEIIRRGFLRRLMPQPFGGEGTGMVDLAIVAEEFHAVDCNVSLTLFANLLGLAPLFIAGTPEQHRRLLAPFLACEGAPLAALANSEPGGSANFAAPRPGEGVRTTAERSEGGWRIHGSKQWVSVSYTHLTLPTTPYV